MAKKYSKFNISHNYFENYEIISKKSHSSSNFSNSSFWLVPIPISTLVFNKILKLMVGGDDIEHPLTSII